MTDTLNRTQAPAISLSNEINYIEPERHYTPAGIPVYLMRNETSEAVKLELIFDAGSIYHEKPVAGLTTGMLLAGTADKTMAEINDMIDDHGGYFNASVSADYAYLTIFGLNESMDQLVHLIEDALYHANFPETELTHLKAERKQNLMVSLEKVGTLAQRGLQAHLFQGTPYSRVNQPEDFDGVSRSDIETFFESNFKKGLRKINWVGNPTAIHLDTILQCFGRWSHAIKPLEKVTYTPTVERIAINKVDAVQTGIRMGKILFDRSHPDYHKMTVVNTILGEYFGSRLMSNIREDKGYTYGIGSYLDENQSNGYFVIATEVGNEFLADTLVQIKLEIERMRTELVPQEELSLVKNYLSGQFLRSADGPFAMMDLFSMAEIRGLDYSFYQNALRTIEGIRPEEIMETAAAHLNSEEMLIVTAG
ncbi:MAG: M16 family metallopeptidase [Flavobacteriales bacterium]